jgi:tetratricopeptide (TPR) repeat protein
MKTKKISLALAIVAGIFGNTVVAQRKNETSAAVEYKSFEKMLGAAMMGGDLQEDAMKRSILKAKEYIDLAAVHPETEKSQKTLFYKGEIYYGLLMTAAFTKDSTLGGKIDGNAAKVSMTAYSDAWKLGKKLQPEIEESLGQKMSMMQMGIEPLTKDSKFLELAQLNDGLADMNSIMNIQDTVSIYNSGYYYEKAEKLDSAAARFYSAAQLGYRGAGTYAAAASLYRKAGNKGKAEMILMEGMKKYPTEKSLLVQMVNAKIEAGDSKGAEDFLAKAIEADPNNKVLHYTIGTVLIELKQNDKATASLRKALEIDPNYTDANYQLGAHLVGVAAEIKKEASTLKLGDPKFDALDKKAMDTYREAILPLEKVVAVEPTNREVLLIISQIYRKLGETEKAKEYKARVDALK